MMMLMKYEMMCVCCLRVPDNVCKKNRRFVAVLCESKLHIKYNILYIYIYIYHIYIYLAQYEISYMII